MLLIKIVSYTYNTKKQKKKSGFILKNKRHVCHSPNLGYLTRKPNYSTV